MHQHFLRFYEAFASTALVFPMLVIAQQEHCDAPLREAKKYSCKRSLDTADCNLVRYRLS